MLIKHYLMKGQVVSGEKKRECDKNCDKSAQSMRMVHEWFQEFCSGHMSTSDADIQRQSRLGCCIYSRKDQALENQKAKVQDGCCDCSHSTKNEIICQEFIVVTLLWTKHGNTTKCLRPRNSPNTIPAVRILKK